MDWLEASTKIVDSVAWPITALGLSLIFRGEVKAIIKRIRGFKGLGAEVELDAQIEEKRTEVVEAIQDVLDSKHGPDKKRDEALAAYARAKVELEELSTRRALLKKQLPDRGDERMIDDVIEFVLRELGIDRIANYTADDLVKAWPLFTQVPFDPRGVTLNQGIITTLTFCGICNEQRNLTYEGAELLIATAKKSKLTERLNKNRPD